VRSESWLLLLLMMMMMRTARLISACVHPTWLDHTLLPASQPAFAAESTDAYRLAADAFPLSARHVISPWGRHARQRGPAAALWYLSADIIQSIH